MEKQFTVTLAHISRRSKWNNGWPCAIFRKGSLTIVHDAIVVVGR